MTDSTDKKLDVLATQLNAMHSLLESDLAVTKLWRETLERRCVRHETVLAEVRQTLEGAAGNDSKPGLRIRVDRLEGLAKRLDRFGVALWTMAVGTVGLLIKALTAYFGGPG